MIAPSSDHCAATSRGEAPRSSSRRGPPTRTTCPSTVALTPTAGEEAKPVAAGTLTPASEAAVTMAAASGCSLPASAAAAQAST